ncbi:hypothetical protein F2Q69_00006996 [Brassica cretica]|uniref:Uncharacterized protein n=1 Tax=Brassica cretica TaxID=69181 RepID=A0A8S9P117_BRACR|nr:hypothetical protein F2Q69_00006996 [Brassica cretica]
MIIFSRWQAAMVVACTTHVLLFFSSLTFSLFLLHSHLSSSVIVDMFVYGRGATKQERCRVRFRSPQLVVDLYRRELRVSGASKPSLNHSRDPWRNPSFLADQVNSFIVDSLLVFPYWLRLPDTETFVLAAHFMEIAGHMDVYASGALYGDCGGEVMGSRLTNNLIMESERTHNGEVWVSALQGCQGLIQRLMGLYAEQRLWEPRPVERADDERLIDHGFDPLLPMVYKYMPSSTRSNKETQLLFSTDPASLERSSSTDNNTGSSTDTRSTLSTEYTHLPSTDIFHPTTLQSERRSILSCETWLRP